MAQQAPQGLPPDMMSSEQQDDLTPASYYPQEPNDLTGGLPINLDSLRDGPPGTKPFYPYSTLIRYAIKGSPNQKLLLEDIYYAIESRFPYFRTAPSGWKNSVRHNLSLNPCFQKVPRPLTDRGKGSYWTVNDLVDPRTGVHRVRKKKPKKGRNTEQQQQSQFTSSPSFDDPNAQFVSPTMHPDEAGTSRQGAYPATFPPPFDPNFMLAPRFPPLIPPFGPDERLEVDEAGNVNWRLQWVKELAHLQELTQENEKAGVSEEWFKLMFLRVRGALLGHIPGEASIPPNQMLPATGDQQSPP